MKAVEGHEVSFFIKRTRDENHETIVLHKLHIETIG